MIIHNPDKDGVGEICMKGRHRFMGYYKNEEATMNTIDEFGYLHSGDLGIIDEYGELVIKGRIKELIITAGGENIAPKIIEDEIAALIPIVSSSMVVGDRRKFLSVLLNLEAIRDKTDYPTNQLTKKVIKIIRNKGSKATTIEEAKKCFIVKQYLD